MSAVDTVADREPLVRRRLQDLGAAGAAGAGASASEGLQREEGRSAGVVANWRQTNETRKTTTAARRRLKRRRRTHTHTHTHTRTHARTHARTHMAREAWRGPRAGGAREFFRQEGEAAGARRRRTPRMEVAFCKVGHGGCQERTPGCPIAPVGQRRRAVERESEREREREREREG